MLNLDPGLGKTVTTLTAIQEMIFDLDMGRVLIVAPLLVAEETWPAEIEKWSHTRHLTYSVLTGSRDERERAANTSTDIHVTNKENIQWLVEFWGDAWPYDMLVIDESSCFRNPSKRNRPSKKEVEAYLRSPDTLPKPKSRVTRFGYLCKIRNMLSKVVLLTGTMAPNGLLDLWSQYYLIDGGHRLGKSFNAYRTRWFESDYMGFKWTPKPHAMREIAALISDITLSMRAEDWISLPERIDNIIEVVLPEKVLTQYKRFERTLLLDSHDIEAVNQGVLTQKLLQLANGSIYDEDGNAHEIHDLKLRALDNIIDEANGKPVLVAYSYDFDLAKLRKRYKGAEVLGEAKGQVTRWNNREIPVLLAHPASACFGLNLQDGGYITVWYGLSWNLEHYIQFNARLLRSGQASDHVIIHHIVAKGTVDDRVLAVLADKDADQERLIDATLYQGSVP